MNYIDLRSDTVTKPTPAMRKVMMGAEVGDDVFGEDPTVNKLQERVADLMGTESALFVASGTMGNQVCINCHTRPGDEVICDENNHIYNYEGGAPALLSGVQLHPLPGQFGIITASQIDLALRPPDSHFPQSRLVVLENTHNRGGGTIYPLEEIKKIFHLAREKNLKMHLDGARLWNAHVATGIPLKTFAGFFDSISVCLSKGLGAPVGSVVAGSKDFIKEAHRYRKIYGGGMRQVGILAAAGLYALDNHVERLAEDHRRARRIAEYLNSVPGVQVNLSITQTNIVIAEFDTTKWNMSQLAAQFKEKGLLCVPFSLSKIRFVTHLDVTDTDIDQAITIFQSVLE
jgi:threonine aldolase